MSHLLSTLILLFVLLPAHAALDDVAPATTAPIDPSKAAEQTATRSQALAEEAAVVERVRQELAALAAEVPRRIAALTPDSVTEDAVEQARVDTKAALLRLEDLRVDATNTEQRIRTLTQTVRDLEARVQLLRSPTSPTLQGDAAGAQLELATRDLGQRRDELALEQKHLEQVRVQTELLTQRVALLEQWQTRLEQAFRQQEDRSRREAQADREAELQRAAQAASERAAALAAQLEREGDRLSDAERRVLDLERQVSIERAKLAEVDVRLLRIGLDLERIGRLPNASPRPALREFSSALDTARAMIATLRATAEVLERKVELYAQQKAVIERRAVGSDAERQGAERERRLLSDIGGQLAERVQRMREVLGNAETVRDKLDAAYRESLRRDLLSRRPLPVTADAWQQIGERLATTPTFLAYQVRLSLETAWHSLRAADPLLWLGLLVGQGLLLRLALYLRRALGRAIERRGPEEGESDAGRRYTDRVLRVLQQLLKRNVVGASLSAMIVLALWGSATPQPSFGILVTLVLLWVAVKLPLTLTWLLLVARPGAGTRRRTLYRLIAVVVVAGAACGALAIIARLVALPDQLVDLADQVFMLYLAATFPAALRVRRYLLDALEPMQQARRTWFVVLKLITLLLPLALLTAALLGLAGYINLAWEVARQLMVLIVVLALLIVVLGLLDDLFEAAAERFIKGSGYGRGWTHELLDPLHHIARVLAFVAAAWLPLYSLGRSGESALVDGLFELLRKPFAQFGELALSPYSLGVTLLAALMMFWGGRLLRAVTYRWVLSGVGDSGVRNSLAVFTQYLAVLIGVLVALRVIGVDLTTLAVFAGAVGVGIGFGLQAIANNFISGVLLLIERPLRSGDTVKIGEDEGEIVRIGIRSLTLKTFDNMEVIIPNSEVISNAFTNWTHSDNIIRQVLYFGAAYDFEPQRVVDLIARVIGQHPAVQINPAPLALVWDYGVTGVRYRAQYYVDVNRHNILVVRSEVNLGVWESFRKAGIAMPYPQRDLYIRAWPEGFPAAAPPTQPPSSP